MVADFKQGVMMMADFSERMKIFVKTLVNCLYKDLCLQKKDLSFSQTFGRGFCHVVQQMQKGHSVYLFKKGCGRITLKNTRQTPSVVFVV